MANIAKLNWDNMEHLKLKDLAHSLKGSSAYVGASRIHYACYFIQELYINNKYKEMVNHYPNLVEAAIEFRLYSRKILAERKDNTTYIVQPEHETVAYPEKHYRLEKDPHSGYIYCCRNDQSLYERIAQKNK